MSINDSSILERMKCINLLRNMKIYINDVEIRGNHLFFNYDESISVVCKIGDDILFDFIEFENDIEAAREYFLKQREKVLIPIEVQRKRERQKNICFRSLFCVKTL